MSNIRIHIRSIIDQPDWRSWYVDVVEEDDQIWIFRWRTNHYSTAMRWTREMLDGKQPLVTKAIEERCRQLGITP